MHDDDLNAVLSRAFPQGTALLRFEGGTELLRHAARHFIGSPGLAREVLGPRTTKALGEALLALGKKYVASAKCLLELAESTPEKRDSAS